MGKKRKGGEEKGKKLTMIIQTLIDFETEKCLYFLVRLALETSNLRLKSIIRWSNSKLVCKKRNNGILWVSK